MNDSSHHFSRLLGLLFAVAMLALASRWLQSDSDAIDPPSAGDADAMPARSSESALRVAEASVAPVHAPATVQAPAQDRRAVRLGSPVPADAALQAARPVSAALCHALDERMRALQQQAADGKLPKHEQRRLRAERQRARELLTGLRCRAGGDGYWF